MIPAIIKVLPVIIPTLCPNECQFNFNTPLYANLTNITIPVMDIKRYRPAIVATAHQPLVPAIKK